MSNSMRSLGYLGWHRIVGIVDGVGSLGSSTGWARTRVERTRPVRCCTSAELTSRLPSHPRTHT
eukprot:740231-Rhodomonas_salina.2